MSFNIVIILDMSTIMFYSYTFNVAITTYLPYIVGDLGKGMFSYTCITFNKDECVNLLDFGMLA